MLELNHKIRDILLNFVTYVPSSTKWWKKKIAQEILKACWNLRDRAEFDQEKKFFSQTSSNFYNFRERNYPPFPIGYILREKRTQSRNCTP